MNDPKQDAQDNIDPTWPRAGEVWQHYKGGLYEIIALAIDEAELTPLVIYRSRSRGSIWARPIGNWQETVAGVPRFTRLYP